MQKAAILSAAILLLAVDLFAQSPVIAKQKKYHGWVSRECLVSEQLEVMNDKNFYEFNLLQYVPNEKGETAFIMHLSAPREKWGFGRMPLCFLNIEVNGIPEHKLQPQSGFFKVWNQKETAGGTVVLNFDGAKIEFDAYMREDSPMLWFTFRQPEQQIEPMKSAKIKIQAVVSAMKVDNGKVHYGGVYQRQAKSAVREMQQKNALIQLTAQDSYLILSDAFYDGSSLDKGYGPSFLTFDMNGVQKASLTLGNSWMNQVIFELKSDFKEFKVGIWQQKNGISNEAFLKLFDELKSRFLLK